MTKQSGLGDNLYVDGYDLSGDVGSIANVSGGPAALEVTAIDKSAMERLGGQRDGALEFTSFFDDAALAEHAALKTLPTADRVASYFRGTTIGNAAASLVAKQLNYDPTRNDDGTLTFKTNAVANGYGLDWGVMLTAGKRTDTGATVGGTSVDHGAETLFGGQAYFQVFAFTGTDATIVVRGASDSGFSSGLQDQATLLVTGGAPLASRVVSLSTVRRFIKVNTTTSGGFSNLVFAVVFVRNETAVVF